MKKFFSLIIAAMMVFSAPHAFAAEQWDKSKPAGSSNASDIDTLLQTNNEAQDRLLIDYRKGCAVIPDSAAALKVLPGEIAIPNAAGTVIRYRRNTSTTSVTWSDIDTGAESSGSVTQYYVYAVADADATTFTVKISLSSSAPSGATYYRKIGYFTNNASNDIVSVGNVAGGDVTNTITVSGTTDIQTSSGTYVDMTDMVIYFVSSGRPVTFDFAAPIGVNAGNQMGSLVFDLDGTDLTSMTGRSPCNGCEVPFSLHWQQVVSAGAHTLKAQWKTTGIYSANFATTNPDSKRVMTVTEM